MLPDDTLIEFEGANFLPPRDKVTSAIESWALGGIALSDTSEGITYQWRGYIDGKAIRLQRDGSEAITILSFTGSVTELSIAFDQNMRPIIAYVEDGIAKLYWYDASASQNITTDFVGATNPRLALDDIRQFNIGNSDVIFAYIADSNRLCYRLQRERYGIEHTLRTDDSKTLIAPLKLFEIGMSTDNRFLFATN